MKNMLSALFPIAIIAIAQTVARANGYMLGTIPIVLIAAGSIVLGRIIGNKWDENHRK